MRVVRAAIGPAVSASLAASAFTTTLAASSIATTLGTAAIASAVIPYQSSDLIKV